MTATANNRIPAHILSRLMGAAWKGARKAAKVSGQPVRTHLAEAMRKSWADFRPVIFTDRRTRSKAAETAAAPTLSTEITAAVSPAQRAYAEKVLAKHAEQLSEAFRALRTEQSTDEERALVDAAVERFAGGSAEFWIGLKASGAPRDVARILAMRVAGLTASPRDFWPHSIKMASLV